MNSGRVDNGSGGRAEWEDYGDGASADHAGSEVVEKTAWASNRAGTGPIDAGNNDAQDGGPASDRAWMSGLLILDRTDWLQADDPLYAFALDELLCRAAGAGGPAICHLWRHPRAFVMGLRDSRLPRAKEAAGRLAGLGYGVAVRNSGGAAVPLDPGVVNLSLILPKDRAEDLAFHGDFERMYDLIRLAVRQLGGEASKGEVIGSYCPGDFDLSIAGRKFCGIAQRRQVKSYIVQAFVNAEGEGARRAEVVREFYKLAAEGADPSSYPDVGTDRMASLEELTGAGGGIGGGASDSAERTGQGLAARFAAAVKDVIRAHQTPAGIASAEARLHLPEPDEIEEMAASLRTRYGL